MASATAITLAAGTFLVAAQAQPGGGANPGAQNPGAAQQPSPEPKSGTPKARPQPKTADPKAQNGVPPKGSAQSKEAPAPSGSNPASRADDKSMPKTKTGTKTDAKAKTQAKTDANTNITVQQRTEIRQTIVKSKSAPRVNNVNFNISVGTVVPRSVRVAALPPRVVQIYPQWRGYRYFIVGDEIIIVEPNTLEIVFVLPA